MHVSQFKQSNFLTRADVGKGMLVTIRSLSQENIAKSGAPEELKWVIHFDEAEKPLVVNSTNAQIIAQITKQDDTDAWPGHKIVLYDDPSVSFGGKLVGGIRVRAPRNQPAVKPAAPARKPQPANPEPENEGDPEVPF